MKITQEFIEHLGASKVKRNHWRLTSGGYCFHIFREQNVWYVGLSSKWEHTHAVTHVEELFGTIMEDGVHAGREEMRQEIKDLLNGTD